MGTKKADRSSISKLEIGSETVMGDSRSAQNPKEEEVEGGRQRASEEGEKEGRPPARFTEQESVRPPPTVSLVCVCEPPPPSFGGLGWDGIDGEEKVYPSQFPNSKVALPHDEYIATAAGVVRSML